MTDVPPKSLLVIKTPLVIAIDGPAAAGKGTLAMRLAAHFALPYLDTGLLYRAIGRMMAERGYDLDDAELAGTFAAHLDPDDLSHPGLRGHEAGEFASRVAAHPQVRAALLDFQRAFAAGPVGAVLDGRDIGTTICPDAPVKIYVTATAEVRAARRTGELGAKGRNVEYERILAEIRERDARDSGRVTAPLRPAEDAAILDTSNLDREGAFRAALDIVEAKRAP
jgi:cytidylate kinase